jgi:hypothetical protein
MADPSVGGQAGILTLFAATVVALTKFAGRITGAKIRVVDTDCERRLSEMAQQYHEESEKLRLELLDTRRELGDTQRQATANAIELGVLRERLIHLEERDKNR